MVYTLPSDQLITILRTFLTWICYFTSLYSERIKIGLSYQIEYSNCLFAVINILPTPFKVLNSYKTKHANFIIIFSAHILDHTGFKISYIVDMGKNKRLGKNKMLQIK